MMDPWDLAPDWWGKYVLKVANCKQKEDTVIGDVPCLFDRWCTESAQYSSPLPIEIDPEAFRLFLDIGPELPKIKKVRFSLTPEVHYFDEGCESSGSQIQADLDRPFVGITRCHSSHSSRSKCLRTDCEHDDIPDEQAVPNCLLVCDATTFCEDMEKIWNRVMPICDDNRLAMTCRHDGEADLNEAFLPARLSDDEAGELFEDEDEEEDDIPVSFYNWEQFVQGIADTPIEDEGHVKLVTFGLRNFDIGRRDIIATSLHPNHLRAAIWEAWQDQAEQFEDLDVHYVVPQPWDEIGENGVIVLLIEICPDSTVNEFRPVLVHSVFEEGEVIEHLQGAYVPWPLTRKVLVQRFRFWSFCMPFGFRRGALSCAGDHVDFSGNDADLVVLARGSFCKLTIGRLPGPLEDATGWISGFEKMAINALDAHRHHDQRYQLRLHAANRVDSLFNFGIEDVSDPTRLRASLSSSSGSVADCRYKYINCPDVFMAHRNENVCFHLLECPLDHAVHCLIVSQSREMGRVFVIGSKAVSWISPPDLNELHQMLVAHFGIQASSPGRFFYAGDLVDSLDFVVNGEVIVHESDLLPSVRGRSRSRTPPGRLDIDDSSSDGLSLLQLAVHRVISTNGLDLITETGNLIVVDEDGVTLMDGSPDTSCFQLLSQAATQKPKAFVLPQSWSQVGWLSHAAGSAPIWTRGPAEKAVGQSLVLAEILLVDDQGDILVHSFNTMVTNSTVDWGSLTHVVCKTLGIQEVVVDKLVPDCDTWSDDQSAFLDDGSFVQIWCLTSTSIEPTIDLIASGSIGSSSLFLISILGLQDERLDFIAHSKCDLDEVVNELAGGCNWTFFTHPQQLCSQIVVVVNWEAVATLETQFPIVMRGTLRQHFPIHWQPISLKGGLCIPDDGWDADGVVLRNGCCIDDWITGVRAVHGDCVLWIASSSSIGGRANLCEAPCPCDRWCADLSAGTVSFGGSDADKFCTWMQHQAPCSKAPTNDEAPAVGIRKEVAPPKVQISLEASLNSYLPPPDEDRVTIQIHREQWMALLRHCEVVLASLPEGVKLHPSTAKALSLCSPCMDIARTLIYIDGSAGDVAAGWSVVVVYEGHGGETQFAGCICGNVCTNEAAPDWIGAHSANNIDAELQAMVVAQTLVLKEIGQGTLVIRPDLQFSHHLAALRVGARNDQTLPAIVAALGSLTGSQVLIHEVRGHVGDPWNEMADRLAKFAMHSSGIHGRFPQQAVRHLATHKLHREWLWWGLAPATHKAAFPTEKDHGEWLITPCQGTVSLNWQVPSPGAHATQLKCSIATVNVCSARDNERCPGRPKGARATRLDQQLHHDRIAIAGLQETRMPQGQRTTQHYCIFASGGQQCGKSIHFGTEIWISKAIAVASDSQGRPIYLGKEKPHVLHADPRRLILRFTGTFRLTIIAAHAPCLSTHNSSDDVAQWWHDFTQICQDIDDGGGLVCCIDANAPLASHHTDLYGLAGAEKPNRQTGWFQAFLDKTHFSVPATLGCHVGPQHTWIHPKGFKLRRDYGLICKRWFPLVQGSRTLQEFDTGLAHVDHTPAVVDIAGVIVCKPKIHHMIDATLVHSDEGQMRFQEALSTLPMPVWALNVDQHCEYLQTSVMNIAKQVFVPRTKRSKERPQLQEATINLINFKRQVLQMVRCAPPDAVESLVAQLRALEKEVRCKVLDDQRKWYDEWVSSVQASGELHDHKQVFQKLIRLGRKRTGAPAVRPLPMLKNEAGIMAQDFQEVQEIFCRQFAELEAGIKVTDADLQQLNVVPQPLEQEEFDETFVPSIWQLQRTLMRFKTGKAPGKSGLTVELFKAGGLPLIHHFLPLMVKAVANVHEPLPWKGGRLFALL